MIIGRTAVWVAGALVLGLIAGNVTSGWAATDVGGDRPGSAVLQTCDGVGARVGAMMRGAGGRLADVVGELTGRDAQEIAERRRSGDSLAKIADENGVSAEEVVDEAVRLRTRVLEERVGSGEITREQADAALERMRERVAERVESTDVDRAGRGAGVGRGQGRGCAAPYGSDGP